jgi:MFS family permease/HAMP domain-containing protein
MMHRIPTQQRIVIVAALIFTLSTGLFTLWATPTVESELRPALEKKAQVVANPLYNTVFKMVAYGVPLNQLRGLPDLFAGIVRDNPDIAYLAVRDAQRKVVEEYSKYTEQHEDQIALVEVPVLHEQKIVAYVQVGGDRLLIADRLNHFLVDVITILVISFLLAMELLFFLATYTLNAPVSSLQKLLGKIAQRDLRFQLTGLRRDEVGQLGNTINHLLQYIHQATLATFSRLGHHRIQPAMRVFDQYRLAAQGRMHTIVTEHLAYVRPPLFLLVFAEAMSLSFLPRYASEMYQPIAGLSKDILVGLPISFFMLICAISLPFAGQWSDRVGRRRALMMGSLATAVGLGFTGLAATLPQLLFWRAITAIGYGMVFVSAQGHVTDHTTEKDRTKGMAVFVSSFFSGSLCGAALGGMLADRIGYSYTFFVSAILALAAALFTRRFLVEREESDFFAPHIKPALRWLDFKLLFKNKNFLAVTFLAAIPAKIALTGFLYYAVPLYMASLGETQSSAGRIIMMYGLAIIIISPLSAWLVDHYGRKRLFVLGGGAVAGLSTLVVFFENSLLGMLLSVVILGLSHAICVSPQLSLISSVAPRPELGLTLGKTIGIFRLTERAGNILGPLVAGVLMSYYGFSGVFLGFCAFTVISVSVCALLLWWFDRGPAALAKGAT